MCTDAVAYMGLWFEEKALTLALLAAVLSCPQVVQTLKEGAAPSSVLLFNTHYCIIFQSPTLTTVRLLVIDEVF